MNPQLGVLAGRSLFTVAGRTYAWEDVLLAAELRGELGELERQTRQGLACLRRLATEPDALPAEALRAAATVFRYEHNLLAAEELEAWLDARGLSAADWNGYLRRLILRERWADELERIASEFAVGDDEVEAALQAEAICSGFLRRAAERLAEDAALAATDDDAEDSGDRATLDRRPRPGGGGGARPRSEPARGRARDRRPRPRLDPDRGRDARARRRRGGARGGALRPRRRPHRWPTSRTSAALPANALVLYLADADPELRTALVSASPGELIGPLERGAGHMLLQLRGEGRAERGRSGARTPRGCCPRRPRRRARAARPGGLA